MKNIKLILIMVLSLSTLIGCQDLVDGINEDPNRVLKVDGKTLFTGIQLADISSQSGFLSFAGGVSCGYFQGDGRLQSIQDYEYLNTDSNTPWSNIYVGVVNQARNLRSGIPVTNKDFFYGVSKVIEAHALATATNVFGSIPFTEAGKVPTPKYNKQSEVYKGLHTLLDTAILDLKRANTSGGIDEDLFFKGNAAKWIKVIYTLKARLYLDVRNYTEAVEVAKKGITTKEETMKYMPPNVAGGGDINLLNSLLIGSTTGGDLTVENSYLIKILGTGTQTRNNAKTNEVDRAKFYYNGTDINKVNGIAAPNAPMNQISLQENLLTWAEAAVRTGDFNTALAKLNEHRANLKNGVYFPVTAGKYDAYVEADFVSGGIENTAGLTKENALLKEILEERYVTFFTEILGFNDMRRVEKDTPENVQVAIPYNVGTKHPQRFLYPFTEENTNGANVPKVTSIFEKTEINK